MKSSDRFLIAFNSIETSMKEILKIDHYVPFSRLIQNSKRNNSVIRKYYDDLREFSELRNAIVHNTFDLNHAIAEPHDDVVEKIEFIEKEISQPKKVIPLFQREVTTFQSTDTLKKIFHAINRFSYSKFPIYEEKKIIGLLSKKGIVNWMSQNMEKLETDNFLDTPIKQVLQHETKQKNYKFISRHTTIYDVKEIYKEIEENNWIDALLITENGKPHESLLGIVTLWDLINM